MNDNFHGSEKLITNSQQSILDVFSMFDSESDAWNAPEHPVTDAAEVTDATIANPPKKPVQKSGCLLFFDAIVSDRIIPQPQRA